MTYEVEDSSLALRGMDAEILGPPQRKIELASFTATREFIEDHSPYVLKELLRIESTTDFESQITTVKVFLCLPEGSIGVRVTK